MPTGKIFLYTDGGARGNPGHAGAGFVILDGGKKLAEVGKYLGDNLTNNFAEYEALALALQEAKKLGLAEREIEVRMDSELVVKQINREYKVKDAGLRRQYLKVHNLLADFTHIRFAHVRREENKDADRLVNEAIDEAI